MIEDFHFEEPGPRCGPGTRGYTSIVSLGTVRKTVFPWTLSLSGSYDEDVLKTLAQKAGDGSVSTTGGGKCVARFASSFLRSF